MWFLQSLLCLVVVLSSNVLKTYLGSILTQKFHNNMSDDNPLFVIWHLCMSAVKIYWHYLFPLKCRLSAAMLFNSGYFANAA